MNLLGGFDRDLIFAVRDQVPDAGLRRGAESRFQSGRRSRSAGRRQVFLKFVPHVVAGSVVSGDVPLIMPGSTPKCHPAPGASAGVLSSSEEEPACPVAI